MTITRIYTGADNESHFEDFEIELEDAGDIGHLSERLDATGIIFRRTDPDYNYDWHNAPRRQYIIMLDGAVDVEIGDGTVRRFSTGDIVLVEDTTGRGHISRAVNNGPRTSVFITLD
ncbi:hypothetical protein [Gracilimonas mengyeensis]|uniref:Cupin domain-containing protein n=1 Tax=Gracilimonas mengyeensis TaxID=1302730 RepID=A0A521CHJ0_9BACT|nr:hypothetical protein [Gracilimonas mengyeensis]SMO58211.1 hypothetical protein SAMN06265219_105111 [Gracilimonas mengyeensis]